MSTIDTSNDQGVGVKGSTVIVMIPSWVLTPEGARRHAAWLVAVADVVDPNPEHTFEAILAAVAST